MWKMLHGKINELVLEYVLIIPKVLVDFSRK